MRVLLVATLALVSAGCKVDRASVVGKACDQANPCPNGLECIDGACWDPCNDARLGQPCTEGKGECAVEGVWQCKAFGVVACSAKPKAAQAEVCNFKDDDCDGTVDNPEGGCECTPGETAACSLAGSCPEGVQTCRSDRSWGSCAAPPCSKSVGVCSGKVKSCGATGWVDCAIADFGADYQETEITCDGKDNDCDGVVDNVSGCVMTLAGGAPPGYQPGTSASARFHGPTRILALTNGDILVADTGNHLVRRISAANGEVTIEAGSPGVCGREDGLPLTGKLCFPMGLAVLPNKDIFIADSDNHQIRSYASARFLETRAGDGQRGYVDGPAASARFAVPTDLAVDGDGVVYIADSENCVIRRLQAGTVSTYAGTACGPAQDGPALSARFGVVRGIFFEKDVGLWVADTGNHKVRLISLEGQVTTAAGSTRGFKDGRGTEVQFDSPEVVHATFQVVVIGEAGNHRFRLLMPTQGQMVSTATGKGYPGFSDGAWTEALVGGPAGIASMGSTLYIGGALDHRIRETDLMTRSLVPFAGGGPVAIVDGLGATATLGLPAGMAMKGTVAYFADQVAHSIRTLEPGGRVVTVAGGDAGMADASLQSTRFQQPKGVAFLGDGRLLVADFGNNRIRVVDFAGNSVTTMAGGGVAGECEHVDGPLASARFCGPTDVAVGENDDVYVAEPSASIVRVIAGGQVVTIGRFGESGTGTDRFGCPTHVARAAVGGLIYDSDPCNHNIRAIDPANPGTVPVVAGSADFACGNLDGPMASARLCRPTALLSQGTDLLFADSGNGTIRRVSSAGVTTVVGSGGKRGFADGTTGIAKFDEPFSIVEAPGGGFYVSDTNNNRIRRVMP